jgi:hypothetical protein
MITLEQLNKMVELRDKLERAEKNLEKMRCVSGVTLYFSGYMAMDMSKETVHKMKDVLVADAAREYRDVVLELRDCGVNVEMSDD